MFTERLMPCTRAVPAPCPIAWRARVRRERPGLAEQSAAGLTAGGVGQLLASPADLVKIRLQTATGKSASGGFLNTVRTIKKQEGWRGFYKGWRPNVTRAAIVNIGELATYDEAKRMVRKGTGLGDGVALHTLSALCSGFVAALMSTPADVCKSRVMSGMYTTMFRCVVGTVQNEGVAALWKGFGPNWCVCIVRCPCLCLCLLARASP